MLTRRDGSLYQGGVAVALRAAISPLVVTHFGGHKGLLEARSA